MRLKVFVLALFVAALVPVTGNAQVQLRTPLPEVTAAAADWQVNGDAIVVGGLLYFPTREFRMFDGAVFAQVGTFGGVPVYADMTRELFTFIYVPVSQTLVRAYERPRNMVGTGAVPDLTQRLRAQATVAPGESVSVNPSVNLAAVAVAPPPEAPVPVGTAGSFVVASRTGVTSGPARRGPALQTIPAPRGLNALWVEFGGSRWYSNGSAATFSSERFTPVGEHHGRTVYRERSGSQNVIWVPTVPDGPLAPYRKR